MSKVLSAIHLHAHDHPDATALSSDGCALSYGALAKAIDSTAIVFSAMESGSGPVALCLDNSPAWVVIDLALVKLGRPCVPLPAFFTEAQREHALHEAGVSCVITDLTFKAGTEIGSLFLPGATARVISIQTAPVALPRDTAKITYTSGTTGAPKGVCLSQSGLEAVSQSLVDAIGVEFAGTHCAVLPLAVLLENVAGLYTTLLAGGHYHVQTQAKMGFGAAFVPDFQMLVSVLAACKATSAIMVPEILRGVLQVLATQVASLTAMKLVAVGGARVAPSLLEAAARVGLPVFEGYGLSECASVVTLNTPRDARPGTAGKVLPHVELSIADDGEILVRSPAFLGYCGGTLAPSLYSTGDIGRIDEKGFLNIEGRKSNVLITAFGRNVAPEWVESELLAQPQVAQAFVFGEGAPALGALIVPASMAVTNDALNGAIARANANLPEYAQVRYWSKSLPFTPLNGQLTANGRLRRPSIAVAHAELMAKCLKFPGQHVSFFERLVSETESERNYLMATPQIRDGLVGRISLETYRLYLAEAYHHVRHTVPLMSAVRDRLTAKNEWLRPALDDYIDEESGHDEWILDDIRNAGGDAESVRRSGPRISTEMMVAYAYDTVHRLNPVGFFGMVFVLEGTSTQLATKGAQALMRTLHLPENCFHYLTSHGALDIGHMQFFQQLMNRVDDPQDQAAIIHMAKRMFVLFSDVFRSIPHNEAVQHAA